MIIIGWLVGFVVFNATFNNISNISWRLVFLLEETGEPGENHRPKATDKLYHKIITQHTVSGDMH